MRKTGLEKTILLNNSLLERLRFFLPVNKIVRFLKQKENILDVELLNSIPSDERISLLNHIQRERPGLLKRVEYKEKVLFKIL